jgi:hypothetical protein
MHPTFFLILMETETDGACKKTNPQGMVTLRACSLMATQQLLIRNIIFV